MVIEIALLLGYTVFAGWVILFGGAEWLEGKLLAVLLVDSWAYDWHSTAIKVSVGLGWVACVFWLIWGRY